MPSVSHWIYIKFIVMHEPISSFLSSDFNIFFCISWRYILYGCFWILLKIYRRHFRTSITYASASSRHQRSRRLNLRSTSSYRNVTITTNEGSSAPARSSLVRGERGAFNRAERYSFRGSVLCAAAVVYSCHPLSVFRQRGTTSPTRWIVASCRRY